MLRIVVAVAAVAVSAAGWSATSHGGALDPAAVPGLRVGAERVAPDVLDARAIELAHGRPAALAAARRGAGDRATELLWLRGEAAARGLRPAPGEAALRGAVADAVAAQAWPRDPRALLRAFTAYHRRWRARTTCSDGYRDPYQDRCGNLAGATAGSCRWLGEASLCSLAHGRRARWLVVQDAGAHGAPAGLAPALRSRVGNARRHDGSLVLRTRTLRPALAVAAALYASARGRRGRAARARERAARASDPVLSAPALAPARAACARQVTATEPYMFGFGMQDVAGAVEGMAGARRALARDLRDVAGDGVDVRKLGPLLLALAAGDRSLVRLAVADAGGDPAAVTRALARLDAQIVREQRLARGLGLGDCLARPAA